MPISVPTLISYVELTLSMIAPFIIPFGIFAFLIFAFLRSSSFQKKILRDLTLLPKIVTRLEKLERFSLELKGLTNEVRSITSSVSNEVRSITSSLSNIEQKIQEKQALEPKEQKESSLQTFCRLYNAVIEDSNKRGEFERTYQFSRIGVVNAMERLRDSMVDPIFQTANDGDYYVVDIEKGSGFAVVPRFALTLQESSHGAGAMGEVFKYSNYNSQFRYPRVKVVKPAFFEPGSVKQRWMLAEKGELDLGEGE